MLSFALWQQEVVALLRKDFAGERHRITIDEVDWAAWRVFYDQGRTPRDAIERALERGI